AGVEQRGRRTSDERTGRAAEQGAGRAALRRAARGDGGGSGHGRDIPRTGGRRMLDRWRTARPQDQPEGACSERLAERSRAERRLLWRRLLITLGVVVALGAVAWAVLVSSLLALDLEQVSITGTGEGTTVATGDVLALVEP